MGVTVGEVEAVLGARDTMSPVMVNAAQRVADLRNQLGNLGVESVEAFDKMNNQLLNAEARFNQLQQAATPFDNLITRMVERLAVFYALREAVDFTVTIFKDAEAFVKLNEQTGLSVELLSQLKAESDTAGVKFDTISTAVNTLDKNLGNLKLSTNDAIHQLGLDIGEILQLSPDERFEAIARAISGIADPTRRAAIEMKLFGTDAIDPVIKKYDELKNRVKDANTFMDEDTARALAAQKQYYESWSTIAEGAIARVIDKLQAAFVLSQQMSGLFGGPLAAVLQNQMENAPKGPGNGGKDISLPSETGNTQSIQEYINSLQAERLAVQGLNEVQEQAIHDLREMGLLDEQHVANLHLTTDQYKEVVKQIKEEEKAQREADKAARDLKNAWEEVNSVGLNYRETVEGMDGDTVEWIKEMQAAGVSLKSIMLVTGETAAVIRDINKVRQEDIAAIKKHAEQMAVSVKEEEKLQAEINDLTVKLSGSTTDILLANQRRVSEDEEARMKKAGANTEAFEKLREERDKVATDVIIHNHELEDANSRASFEKRYNDARSEYEFKVSHADQYTQKDIQLSKDRMDQAKTEWEHWRDFADGALDSTIKKVTLLSGKIVSLGDILKGFVTGTFDANGNEITGPTTMDRYSSADYISAATSINSAGSKIGVSTTQAQVLQMVTAGAGSLTDIITLAQDAFKEIAAIMAGYPVLDKTAIARWKAIGGSVPNGFAGGVQGFSGGPALVGEAGPELVTLPTGSNVYPNGSFGGASVVFAPGSIVMQYPIIQDPTAMNFLGKMFGDAVIERMRGLGMRIM